MALSVRRHIKVTFADIFQNNCVDACGEEANLLNSGEKAGQCNGNQTVGGCIWKVVEVVYTGKLSAWPSFPSLQDCLCRRASYLCREGLRCLRRGPLEEGHPDVYFQL